MDNGGYKGLTVPVLHLPVCLILRLHVSVCLIVNSDNFLSNVLGA